MPWQDRVRPGAYTSPSGRRFEYDFEDVRLTLPKKTTAFDFPDATGTYIQDKGTRGLRLPLRMFLSGADYDLVAKDFLNALAEVGTGILEHPAYGTFNVVPFGDIARKDNLKTAGNQAVFEVEFWENNDIIFPASQQDGLSKARIRINDNIAALAAQFSAGLNLNTAQKRSSFRATYLQQLSKTSTALTAVAADDDVILQRFKDIQDSIETSIELLLDEPDTLSQQTTRLITVPAQANAGAVAQVNGYTQVVNSVLSSSTAVRTANVSGVNQNLYQSDLLFMVNSVIGATTATLNAKYETKTEAVSAAMAILELFYATGAWIDDSITALNIIDPGAAYQKMLDAVSLAAGYLVQFSFSLKQERSIVLVRTHTIIDLLSILYGPENVEDNIDFMIKSNSLTGSEILELPIGRTIKYYV